jgi:hypothetical protein
MTCPASPSTVIASRADVLEPSDSSTRSGLEPCDGSAISAIIAASGAVVFELIDPSGMLRRPSQGLYAAALMDK